MASLNTEFVAYAMIFFGGLSLLEFIITKKLNLNSFGIKELVISYNCVGLSFIFALSTVAFLYYPYQVVFYQVHLIVDYPMTPFIWFLVYLAIDLIYYWQHRLAHTKYLWPIFHEIHHQSTQINTVTGLRAPVLYPLYKAICYLPLAFLKVPLGVILTLDFALLCYQFFVHTELLRPGEGLMTKIFVTPSHHRVHHSLDGNLQRQNFGGTFIIWDKIFKTFTPETGHYEYGLKGSTQTSNVYLLNLFPLLKLLKLDHWVKVVKQPSNPAIGLGVCILSMGLLITGLFMPVGAAMYLMIALCFIGFWVSGALV